MFRQALAIVVCCASAARAQPASIEYRLELDSSFSMRSGVTDLTTIARLSFRAADGLERRTKSSNGAGSLALRFATMIAIDTPVAISAVVLAHELFGHGARAREHGFAASYELAPPPPYALLFGGELRSSTSWDFGDRVPATIDETALFHLGGLEANELQLRGLAFTAFRARSLARGDALLYASASIELSSYVARDDGDIELFYAHLRDRYGADVGKQRRITQLSAALTLVDPVLAYSLYGYLYRHLVRGERALPYPSVDIGGVELSLGHRLLLVPWGREHELATFVGTRAGNVAATIGLGEGPGGGSASLSLQVNDIPLGRGWFAGGQLHASHHPWLGVVDRDTTIPSGQGMLGTPISDVRSIGGEAGVEYRVGAWVLGARLGAKTAGYAVGKPYASQTTGLVSIAARIPSSAVPATTGR